MVQLNTIYGTHQYQLWYDLVPRMVRDDTRAGRNRDEVSIRNEESGDETKRGYRDRGQGLRFRAVP